MTSRCTIICGLLMGGLVFIMSARTMAQEGIARIVYLQDVADNPKQGLTDAVQKLKEQTQQLRETMSTANGGGQGDLSADTQTPQIGPSLPVIGSTSTANPEQQGRLKTIEENIGLLRKLYSENSELQTPGVSNPAEIVAPPGSQTKAPQNRPTPQLTAAQAHEFMNKASGGSMSKTVVPHQSTIVATQVVPGIVDSFELGNSLFISGEIPAALVAYNNVDRTKLSMFDRTWLEILVGCCHRRLGQYELAEVSYDEVVGAKNGVRSAKIAEDWLVYIAKRRRTNAAVETAGASADQLLQQAETFLNEYQAKN